MPDPIKKSADETPQENLQVAELQKALQALQEQNKQLLAQQETVKAEKLAQTKKLEEEQKAKEKEALEKDSDLEALLKELKEPSEEEKKKSSRSVDQLSNEELIGVIGETVEKFVDAKIKLDKEDREKTQDGFLKKLGNVENMLGQMVALQSVNDLRARFPDFESFKQDIGKLLQETPGLSIEKAYKLAKAERLEKEPPVSTVETEFPNIGPSGLPAIPERKDRSGSKIENNNTGGVAAFRNFLNGGIARALANRAKQ